MIKNYLITIYNKGIFGKEVKNRMINGNIYEKHTLEELSIEYIRFLELWNTGQLYSNRAEIHNAIFERLGLDIYERSDDIEANRILHNLDKEVGYKIGFEYDDKEIEKMGKRLARKFEAINIKEVEEND